MPRRRDACAGACAARRGGLRRAGPSLWRRGVGCGGRARERGGDRGPASGRTPRGGSDGKRFFRFVLASIEDLVTGGNEIYLVVTEVTHSGKVVGGVPLYCILSSDLY